MAMKYFIKMFICLFLAVIFPGMTVCAKGSDKVLPWSTYLMRSAITAC